MIGQFLLGQEDLRIGQGYRFEIARCGKSGSRRSVRGVVQLAENIGRKKPAAEDQTRLERVIDKPVTRRISISAIAADIIRNVLMPRARQSSVSGSASRRR